MERGGENGDGNGSSSFYDDAITKSVQTPTPYSSSQRPKMLLPPTSSLPLLNFIDMFAVALVVPLLFQYYKNAGVTSANQRELLSSVFSSSQILGGILLGALTDAKIIRRKTVLYMSFGGSAIAYAMIAFGGFTSLIASRVIVGLVKQTMTVSTSIMTRCTTEQNRAKYMGRLQSSTTAAWILGPSVGGILYKYVDQKAPVLLASLLFVMNLILSTFLLPDGKGSTLFPDDPEDDADDKNNKKKGKGDFWTNLKTCTSSKSLLSVIISTLLFAWVNRATSYASMGSYYEDMYGMESYHRGYIQSYQRILALGVQFGLVGPILSRIGGERYAICIACLSMAIATFAEIQQSMWIFLIVIAPIISTSTTMITVSLRSLLTTVAPEESIFSVFAVLDVLQNVAAVSVPFYRAALFQVLLRGNLISGDGEQNYHHHSSAAMEGDPDPVSWVFSSGIHWVVAAVVMTYFLSPHNQKHSNIKSQRSGLVKQL